MKKKGLFCIGSILLLLLVACGGKTSHEHAYSEKWSSDENEHWYACECGDKKDKEAHKWDSGTITVEPTLTNKGEKTYTCTVCGKTKKEDVPVLSNIKWLCTTKKHWYLNEYDLSKVQEEEHTFKDDLCSVCGYHKTMIPSSYEWETAIALTAGNWTIEEECTASGLEYYGLFKRAGSISYFYTKHSMGKDEYYLENNSGKLVRWESTIQPGKYEDSEYEYGLNEFNAQRMLPFDNVTENIAKKYESFTYDENTRTYKAAYLSVNINDTIYEYKNAEFSFYDGKLVNFVYVCTETNKGSIQAGPTTVHFSADTTKITKPWDNDLDFYYTETEGGILFTGIKRCDGEEYTVPTEVEIDGNTVAVVGIGDNAFTGTSLKSLIIPDSITNIAASAFDNSNGTSIKKITASTEVLSKAAGVNGLEEVVISSCSSGILSGGFSSSLRKITLLEGITEIADDCFYNCSRLESITLPSSLEKIGKRAFKYCDSLTSIILPNEIKVIEEEAFFSCDNLQTVVLPNALESIKDRAFMGSSILSIQSFPATLTSIGNEAFKECYYLADTTADNELVLPDGLKTIGEQAFMDTGLTKVTLPNSVSSVGNGCFRDSKLLKEVVLGNKLEKLPEAMFRACVSLTTVDTTNCENLTSIEELALLECKSLHHFVVPNTVTSIGEGAFGGCSGLTQIVLPFIGAQSGVKEDSSLRYPFGYIFGSVSYSGCIKTQQRYYDSEGAHDVSYYIPASLEIVNIMKDDVLDSAFLNVHKENNKSLRIFIDDEVQFVDAYAFTECNIIYNRDFNGALYLPNCGSNINSICVGFDTNVVSAVLSETTHMVAKNVGAYSQVETIEVDESFKGIICEGAFAKMNKLKSVKTPLELLSNFPKTVIENLEITRGEALESQALAGYTALKNLILPASISTCGYKAFEGTEGIQNLIAPSCVLEALSTTARLNIISLCVLNGKIPSNAFKDSSNLINLRLEEGVLEIGNNAFENCTGLSSLELPASLTKIDYRAFKGCTGFTELDLPTSVEFIGQSAFENCTNLTKASVFGTIDLYIFAGCAKLEELVLNELNSKLIHIFGTTAFEDSISVQIREGINNFTYYFPKSFKKLTVLEGVIAEYALNDSPIEAIVLGASVTEIKSGFNLATVHVYYDGTIEDWCNITFQYQGSNPMSSNGHFYLNDGNDGYEEVTEIVIPDTMEAIGNYQFYNFNQLESITIPSSVQTIGDSAFKNCSNLTIYCEATSKPNGFKNNWNCDRPYYFGLRKDDIVEVDDFVVAILNEEISIFDYLGNAQNLVIPEKMMVNETEYPVTKIEAKAFEDCTSLLSVVIPNSIVTIGNNAFAGCNQITSLTYGVEIGLMTLFGVAPTNLTEVVLTQQSSIPYQAFSGCSGLTTIYLPNSLNSINASAFSNCTSLTDVYYDGTIEDWCNVIINNEDSNPMKYASHFHSKDQAEQWEEVTSLVDVFNGRSSINKYQFYGFEQITSIVVPNNVESIGIGAFGKCNNVVDLTIPFVGGSKYPPSSEMGGTTLFGYIFGITNYTYHDTLLPSGLTTVKLTGGTQIGSAAFGNWVNLKTIIIPDTVTFIKNNAFCDCTNLEIVYIPSSVVNMESYIFNSCPNVTVYCGASSKPSNWNSSWNQRNMSTTTPVVWGAAPMEIKTSGDYQLSVREDLTAAIIKYKGEGTEHFEIPEIINVDGQEYQITEIWSGAFETLVDVTSLVVPSSVVLMRSAAFKGLSSLEQITLPYIGASLKSNSQNFSYIFDTVPSSLTKLTLTNADGIYVRIDAPNIQDLVLSASVKYFSASANFSSNTQLTNVYYEGTLEDWFKVSIINSVSSPMYAASHFFVSDGNGGWQEVTEIVIPSTITKIGNNQFYGFENITSVVIPQWVTAIGDYAFYGCTSLTDLEISPQSLPSFGTSCLPSSVYNVDNGMYYYGDQSNPYKWLMGPETTYQVRYTIKSGAEVIVANAFKGCSDAEDIIIPTSIKQIDSSAFDCYRLTNVYYEGSIEDWCKIKFADILSNPMYYASHFFVSDGNEGWQEVTEIEIPATLTEVGNYQFYGFVSVTSITIPEGITNIGISAFAYCSLVSNIVIPSSVTAIGNNAFNECSGITNLEISEGVTSIGSSAFSRCTGLTSVVIPEGVTTLGNGAFLNCSNLITVSLPNSLMNFDESIFRNCNKLKYTTNNNRYYLGNDTNPYLIEVKDTTKTTCTIKKETKFICDGAFSFDNNLSTVRYEGTIEDWCKIKFAGSSSNPMYFASQFHMKNSSNQYVEVTSIEIPESVTEIGDYQFCGFGRVTSILLPNSLTSVGIGAFNGCNSVQYNEYENGNYLGSSENPYMVFVGLTDWRATEIVIHEQTKMISATALSGSSYLTSVTIPEGLISIGSRAFYNCIRLESITIPSTVTSIGEEAFYGCSSLKSVVLLSKDVTIEETVFYNLNLEEVYFFGNATDWDNLNIENFGNGSFKSATRYYFSATTPLDNGNYWYYDENVPTKW